MLVRSLLPADGFSIAIVRPHKQSSTTHKHYAARARVITFRLERLRVTRTNRNLSVSRLHMLLI